MHHHLFHLGLIAICGLIAIGVLLFSISLRPAEFSITRAARISAPPETIFPFVNELHQWEGWSPWAKLDPNAKSTFDGPPAGVGSTMKWSGNNKVGEGKMTITESRPNELIRIRLEFFRPMKATNIAEFNFKPDGNQTTVTWSMAGKNNFMGKAFSLFVDCDKMIGGQFEQGLQSLKALAETAVNK